jgi:hypothetical protein
MDDIYENSPTYNTNAPILAFHEPNGNEFIIYHGSTEPVIYESGPEPDWGALALFCGPGTNVGTVDTTSTQNYGFIIPDMPSAVMDVSSRVYTQNTYIATGGGTHTSTPFFYTSDGTWYYLTWGDDDCSGYQTIGPFTAEEANSLYPMTHKHLGAGTGVTTIEDTWGHIPGVKLLIGYYPRTFAVLTSRETAVLAAYTQTATRISDTGSDYEQTIGGVTAILENDVTALISGHPNDVQTTITPKVFDDEIQFSSVFRTEHGTEYRDDDPDHFYWATGVEIDNDYYSFASYGGEEFTALVVETKLPIGLNSEAVDDWGRGVFIGGI